MHLSEETITKMEQNIGISYKDAPEFINNIL